MSFNLLRLSNWKVSSACAVGIALVSTQIASATLIPNLSNGASITPSGNSTFFADQANGYESTVATVQSPYGYSSVNVGGDTVDLQFYIYTTIYKDTQTGTLDFVYQLFNDSVNNQSTYFGDSITRMTVSSFAGYTLEANYNPNTGSSTSPSGSDVKPVEIDRSTYPGSVVGFQFASQDLTQGNPVGPGAYTDYLVVRTNSTSYTQGTAAVQGALNSITDVTVPYGSPVPVPEPASLGMVGIVGAALLGRRRRAH